MLTVKQHNDLIAARNYFERLFNLDNLFSDFLTDVGIQYTENEDKTLTYSVDVPGVKENDLTVEVLDHSVNIKGIRKTKNSQYSIEKSFQIPKKYNPNSLKANLADGVLTLTLEVKPEAEKAVKKIEINK